MTVDDDVWWVAAQPHHGAHADAISVVEDHDPGDEHKMTRAELIEQWKWVLRNCGWTVISSGDAARAYKVQEVAP